MGRRLQPVRRQLDPPSGGIADGDMPVLDGERIAAEQPLGPGVVVRPLDGQFQIGAGIRDRVSRCIVQIVTSDRFAACGQG